MLKVLFVLPNLQGGGAERVTLAVMRHLDRSRFRPALFLIKNEGVLWPEVPEDVEVFTALESGRRMRWHLPGIVRQLSKIARDADIIIGALEFEAIHFAAITGWLVKCPVIGWVHADLDMYDHSFMTYNLNRQALGSLQRIVAVSRSVAASISRWYPGLEDKIKTIYSPVDLDHLRQQAAIDSPDGESDLPLIVGVGRLEESKNFEFLVLAHADLLSRGIRQRLVIMGEGSQRTSLEQLIRSRGLEDTVSLPGFRSNPFSLIKQASIFVMCSRYEGFSSVILEAMGLGVPVVATNFASGPLEILDHGRYGLLVSSGNRDALVGAIASLMEDVSLAEHYRELGLERAQQFRPEVRIPEFEQVLEQIYQADMP